MKTLPCVNCRYPPEVLLRQDTKRWQVFSRCRLLSGHCPATKQYHRKNDAVRAWNQEYGKPFGILCSACGGELTTWIAPVSGFERYHCQPCDRFP